MLERWRGLLDHLGQRGCSCGATWTRSRTGTSCRRATTFANLLDVFLLEKALYEVAYELNNRPDWVRIPLSGIMKLLASRDSQ